MKRLSPHPTLIYTIKSTKQRTITVISPVPALSPVPKYSEIKSRENGELISHVVCKYINIFLNIQQYFNRNFEFFCCREGKINQTFTDHSVDKTVIGKWRFYQPVLRNGRHSPASSEIDVYFFPWSLCT